MVFTFVDIFLYLYIYIHLFFILFYQYVENSFCYSVFIANVFPSFFSLPFFFPTLFLDILRFSPHFCTKHHIHTFILFIKYLLFLSLRSPPFITHTIHSPLYPFHFIFFPYPFSFSFSLFVFPFPLPFSCVMRKRKSELRYAAKGRTNVELREQFILAEGVSQSMTPFKAKRSPSSSVSSQSASAAQQRSQSLTGSSGPIIKVCFDCVTDQLS